MFVRNAGTRDKHSSLFRIFISNGCNKFYNIGPRVSIVWCFTTRGSDVVSIFKTFSTSSLMPRQISQSVCRRLAQWFKPRAFSQSGAPESYSTRVGLGLTGKARRKEKFFARFKHSSLFLCCVNDKKKFYKNDTSWENLYMTAEINVQWLNIPCTHFNVSNTHSHKLLHRSVKCFYLDNTVYF